MEGLKLEIVDDDLEEVEAWIRHGFHDLPRPDGVGAYASIPFGFTLRDDQGALAGGVTGHSVWEWLYVHYLWVAETRRGQGLGTRLLNAAESEAEKRGDRGIWLHTLSYQAPAFYERMGYERFGELPDFPRGHERIFYRKRLKPSTSGGAA